MTGLVIIAHERGNCSAYNAGWQTAILQFPNFRYLLVIDDDELADPDWLDTCEAAKRFGADIVGGPQVPLFAAGGDDRFAEPSGLRDRLTATGLSLRSIRRAIFGTPPRARSHGAALPRPRFNFMGGGDSDFLSRSAQKGFTLAWSAEAGCWKPYRRVASKPAGSVPAACATASSRRSSKEEARHRAGGSAACLRQEPGAAGRLAFPGGGSTDRRQQAVQRFYPIHVALGRVLAEFGYANEQYRNPEKN